MRKEYRCVRCYHAFGCKRDGKLHPLVKRRCARFKGAGIVDEPDTAWVEMKHKELLEAKE